MARTATRRAAALPVNTVATAVLVEEVGLLGNTLGAIDGMLEVLLGELERRVGAGELEVAEGPFVGEPEQALATMLLWVEQARAASATGRQAIENAHKAAAGLASAR
ncbi:hypothetical protein GCM10027598_47350 [Amycolatopsis oliviviridis]|uniref:Uncharacterized protein n=1 Tax=Amycolatopsis oliviviridis TaxID=1471590 RepID=A0ABQ3MBF1_9PSEU|nr:hypothetical protein [Amycolatopsis oliviviridis]GHH37640.1 hypothetical protein GCM10017790_82190 [Amycolatopsis oliviviridis]